MNAFESEKQGLESNATLHIKPVQLQEHECDMVSFRADHNNKIKLTVSYSP